MASPGASSQKVVEHVDLSVDDLDSDIDLPDFGLTEATAAATLAHGSNAAADKHESELHTAVLTGGVEGLMDYLCDSPEHPGAAALQDNVPQQQQQQQQGASAAPASAGAAAAKLAGVFAWSHTAAAAAGPAFTARVGGDSSFASGSAAFAGPTATADVQQTAATVDTQQLAVKLEEEEEEEMPQPLHVRKPRATNARARASSSGKAPARSPAAATAASARARKHQGLTAADKELLAVLNLPKATVSKRQAPELEALGIFGEPDASRHFYMNRGPQATLRAIARRIGALLPQARAAYLAVCREKGLSLGGGQLSEKGCNEFFLRLLGRDAYAAFKPSQEEKKPLRELDYTARLLSMVAGHDLTAFEVNECFIAGQHNYEVDYEKLLQLGVAAATVTLPLTPPGRPAAQLLYSADASNVSGITAWAAAQDAAAQGVAAALLANPRKGTKRSAAASSTDGLKRRREALASQALLQKHAAAAASAATADASILTAAAASAVIKVEGGGDDAIEV